MRSNGDIYEIERASRSKVKAKNIETGEVKVFSKKVMKQMKALTPHQLEYVKGMNREDRRKWFRENKNANPRS